ncbi:MAG: ABC transporter ATP-binding protein [Rhodoferax sp.]|nr:ABC transporter ATP-binding protein [Rhodoferax sp.]HQX61015.1 ABC transporter ATP-binding protein [Burkholderiaceae bacterium]
MGVEGVNAVPITARGLRKHYGSVRALDDVDLEVRPGEFLTLLGPSGSGKTTLLMVLAGFIRPDQGSLRFGDEEVVRLAPHKRNIGMVFQNYALFPHMDVAGNVAYPLVLRGVKGPALAQRVERALDIVQLSGYGDRRIDALSGGQRQRVALARAIVFEPRIVLMDEPLSALDKQLRERMQIELRRLHDQLGTTTIYVTHDQREALTMSDRIAVIHDGRIRQLDTPRILYERPVSRLVAEFIGESTMLKVTVAPERDSCICSEQVLQLAHSAAHTGAALLMLRPERVQVLAADAPARPGQNQLQARVLDNVYQGDSFLLQAQLSDGSIIGVRGIAGTAALAALPARGETLRMGFEVSDTVLLADGDA